MTLDFCNMTAEQTKRLNQIADSMMKPYTDFVDNYSRKYGDNYMFWATPFASRNIYLDNTFFRVCRIKLAIEMVEEGQISRIITEIRSEYRVLRAVLDKRIEIICMEKWSPLLFCKTHLSRSVQVFRFFKDKMMYILFAGNKGIKFPEHLSLVMDFAVSSNFTDYTYTDKYMPNIADYHENVFFLPVIIYNSKVHNRELLRKIRSCESHRFIVGDGLLRVTDLIEIQKYLKFVRRMRRDKYYLDGMDVSDVVCRELKMNINNRSSMDGLLLRKMIQRMARRGLDVDNFIIWYEGQPADVIVSSTVREEYPDAKLIGYEGFPLEENLMSLMVSDYQYRSGHSPAEITVPGYGYEKLARRFCTDIPIVYVPCLRSEYEVNYNKVNSGKRRLLLLLSIFADVSRQEINMIDCYVKNNEKCSVMIKNHPVNENFSLEDYGVGSVTFDYMFVSGDLTECVQNADVVLASSTTSSMEVLCAGAPLIIMCPIGKLSFSSLPAQIRDELCYISYSYDEIESALNECFLKDGIDSSVLENVMIPKTDIAVARLFEK